MKSFIVFALILVAAFCQMADIDALTQRLRQQGEQLKKVNGFFIALQEVIKKMQLGIELLLSYINPALDVVRWIRDEFLYIFSVQHIITVLLTVLFLAVLLKDEEENQNNQQNTINGLQIQEQGQTIISYL